MDIIKLKEELLKQILFEQDILCTQLSNFERDVLITRQKLSKIAQARELVEKNTNPMSIIQDLIEIKSNLNGVY